MYSPWLVTLSIVLAVGISCIALQLTFDLREHANPWSGRKLGSALMMGLAIPVMHYVGMAAAGFMPLPTMNGSLAHAVSVSSLNIAGIAIVSALIFGMACVTAVVDIRFARQRQALETSQMQLKMVFDNMTEGILVLDHEGKTVLMNKAVGRGCSRFRKTMRNGYAKIVDLYEVYSMDGSLLAPVAMAHGARFARRFCGELPAHLSHEVHRGDGRTRESARLPCPASRATPAR